MSGTGRVQLHVVRPGPDGSYIGLATSAGAVETSVRRSPQRRLRERLRRRARTLLEDATEESAHEPTSADGPYVEIDGPPTLPRRVFLDVDESAEHLVLSFWPADTPTQARALYQDKELADRLLDLAREEKEQWNLVPNMHFGHFQRGYARVAMPRELEVERYVRYWQANLDLIVVVHRPPTHLRDWETLLDQLLGDGIIASRAAFDHDFTATNRNRADVRPGLHLSYRWRLSEAGRLDATDELVAEVRKQYGRVLDEMRPRQE